MSVKGSLRGGHLPTQRKLPRVNQVSSKQVVDARAAISTDIQYSYSGKYVITKVEILIQTDQNAMQLLDVVSEVQS